VGEEKSRWSRNLKVATSIGLGANPCRQPQHVKSHLTLSSLGTLEHCRVDFNLPRHRLQILRNIGAAFFGNYSAKIMLDSLAASCLDTVVRVVGIEYGE
jgi:hypothetical protein